MDSFGIIILTSLAFVFVIEGLLWALFPETMKRVIASALQMPEESLRKFGIGAVLFGFTLVYLIDLLAP